MSVVNCGLCCRGHFGKGRCDDGGRSGDGETARRRGDGFLKPCQAAGQTLARRGLGNAQPRGDSGVIQFLEKPQHHHRALIRWQSVDRGIHGVPFGLVLARRVRSHRFRGVTGQLPLMAFPTPHQIARQVDGRPVEPACHARVRREVRRLPRREAEDVLHRLLGERAVAGDPPRRAVDQPRVPLEQLAKSPRPSAPVIVQQDLIRGHHHSVMARAGRRVTKKCDGGSGLLPPPRSRFGWDGHDGRQKMPAVFTARTNRPS